MRYIAAVYIFLSAACPQKQLPIELGQAGGGARFVCERPECPGLGEFPEEAVQACGRGNVNTECRCSQRYCCQFSWACGDAASGKASNTP
jgi:hypothetical protein